MPSDFDNTVEVTESSTTVNKFISTLRNLPPCEEDTFRIFERNHREFYSVHFDTATWASMQIYKTTNVVKYIGGDNITGIPSLNLTPSIGENFMREQIKFKKIELWGLVGKGASQYGPIKKTSPGNYQELEDLLFGEVEIASSPIVMAARLEVSHGNKKIGVCFCDSTMQTFQVLEFLDNDIFSNFESLIIQIGVSECLINLYDSSYDHIKLKEVLERCDVMITKAPNNKFESTSTAQDLSRLLKPSINVETLNELNFNIAMKSTSCLIDYLQLLDYPDNMSQYTIDTYNLSQYVRLDGSAFKALNLMPGAKDSNKYSSLYGLLNHCKTSQGSRLLSQWLKQPCTNPQDIQERLDLVQIFLDDYQLKDTLHNQLLKSIPDLCRICNRVKRNKSSLQDVIRLYQVVIKLPEFVQAIDQSQHASQLEDAYNRFLREYTTSLQKLQEMVEETVDLAAADNHVYKIKPNFDPKLKEVDVQMENTLNQINKLYRQMANQLDLEMDKKIKLERSNIYGYCFRVTKSDAPKLRNESGIVELSVQKTATLFTTAKLKQFSEEFEDLSTSYNTVQSALVSQVLVVTSSYCNVFEALNGLIAHLDVIVSFAQAAESAPFPYVKPNILVGESDRLELRGARHPCLERQEDVSFIPNNLSMERDKKEFLIITGPNMGGKSTYIRQTAIIVLMAQIGSFVPCTQADICIFDGILARVGAGDSQLKGISTFMAEMLETSNIIKSATSKTLIVIDELGRGTSTYDGFGLAWAISEHISTNIKAFCLFATHFHELTTLKDKVPTVHNLHVTAHIDSNSRKMALLYEIREGVCDQSFGIHVAEIANCPSSVVKLAKRKVEQLEAQEQHTDNNYGLTPQQIQEGIVKMEKFKQLANSADPSKLTELKALAQEISQDPYIQKILQNF